MESNYKRKQEKLQGSLSPPPVPARKQKIESATTREAVSSFFKPMSSKQTGEMAWTNVGPTVLAGHFRSSAELASSTKRERRRKIGAFDLDSTLIKSRSGSRYSGPGPDDWTLWHPLVPKKLRQLEEEEYQIVIVSNQSGLNLNTGPKTSRADLKRVEDFKHKVTAVAKQLDVSLSFYAATERDQFRKPLTGMWSELLDHFDLDGTVDAVDKENSLFVGDAGGRTKEGKAGKDFSSSDRDFASNVGIKFFTPEEFFLKEASRAFRREFDPRDYISEEALVQSFSRTNKQDVVVLCGSPGAGKSTFYHDHLAPLGYERINQDMLKTREKCLELADGFLKAGKSVAIDNTNRNEQARSYWVELAQKHQVPVRTVVFKTSPQLCEHNDAVRALNGPLMNPEGRTRLPRIAFLSFNKQFREPSLEEGFQDIVTVEFRFVGSEEQKAAWTQYYV